ncbi:hypothetical protein ACM26V_00045 [Salipaludibacillus sp. HK11]|uniref:hypothetical protein n=1 Tax=Salipaludibacillus sp. HK11 TaxID=3394320 RepID=UPI0039FD2C14
MYKVIRSFVDLEDNRRLYEAGIGKTYPREGLEPTPERIEALSTSNNKRKKPFIEKVETENDNDNENDGEGPEFPKPTKEGSTWYELSNGEKVNGKTAAIEAEGKLKSGE